MTSAGRAWRGVAAVVVLACGAATATGQQPDFSTAVELVTVGVTVTNLTRERFIEGLTAADFRIFENGEPVPVGLVSTERQPVSLCLVLDASGSMGLDLRRQLAQVATTALLRQLEPGDEIAAVVFRTDVDVRLGWTPVAGLGPIDWGDAPIGGTAILDGLRAALALLDDARHPRRAIVLLTDGIENSSRLSLESLSTTRRQSEAVVYAVALASTGVAPAVVPPRTTSPDLEMPVVPEVRLINPRSSSDLVLPQPPKPVLPHLVPAAAGPAPVASVNVLDALVQDGGGTLMRVTSGAEATQAARNVVDDLRHQYTLVYTPARPMDGTYRRLRIETTRPGLLVRHRLGYLAAPGARAAAPATQPVSVPEPAAGVKAAVNAAPTPTSAYAAAVVSFRATRDAATARLLVGNWTRAMLSDAVTAAARRDDPDFARAAAVFHLETALDGAPASPDDAMFEITLGERALQRVTAARGGGDEFVARWYAASASVFLAQSDTARAREVAGRGLGRIRGSAVLQFVAGRIEDVEAQRYDADLGRDDRSRLALNMERRGQLALAERAYRQALAVDPRHAAAQLHLGRVLALLDRTEEARRLLAPIAASDSVPPGDRYLATLFLAALHERAGEIERARALLEGIEAVAPGRQTAWVALAQLEVKAGDVERARDAVRHGAATTADTDEWWEYRNGGLLEDEFEWLRASVSGSPR